MSEYIDDIIIQPESENEKQVVLTLGVEVEVTDGRFPDPHDVTNGRIVCISLCITGLDGVMCYAAHELTPYLKGKMDPEDTYIQCKDEADMLTRAIQFIGVCKPTHLRGDSGKDLDFITARARAMHLKIDIPDLDKMFRQYDRKFSDIYGKSGMARKMDILQKCAESRHEFKQQLKRMY